MMNKGRRQSEIPLPKAFAVIALVLAMQVLGGCSGSWRTQSEPLRTQITAAECDELLEASTRKLLSTQLTNTEQLVQTIADTYGVATDKVAVYDESGQGATQTRIATAVRWSDADHDYGIDIDSANQLVSFQIGYRKQALKINDVLLCLGAPESYLAWYGMGTGESGMGLLLMLFYPQQDVIATVNVQATFANATEQTAPIPVDVARLPIIGMRFSPPRTTSTELLHDYLAIDLTMDFAQEPGKSLLAWYTQLLWPWPGDVHQLEYSTLAYPEIPLVPIQPSP